MPSKPFQPNSRHPNMQQQNRRNEEAVRLVTTKKILARNNKASASDPAVGRHRPCRACFAGIAEKRKYTDQKVRALKNIILGRHADHSSAPRQTGNDRQTPRHQQQGNYRGKKSIQDPDAAFPERRKCVNNRGISSRRWNLPRPPKRSAQLTSAHNMPMAASTQSKTGSKPAAVNNSRRNAADIQGGEDHISHAVMKIAVAVVDHGSVTATATASQSATVAQR